jgi:hypothetical protein
MVGRGWVAGGLTVHPTHLLTGMNTRKIVATFKEIFDADISPTLFSKVT